MEIGLIRGLVTLLVFLLFVGIAFWAFSSKRKSDFDAAANLPLDDDHAGDSASPSKRGDAS